MLNLTIGVNVKCKEVAVRIGSFAKRSGLTTRQVRYYTDQHLLSARRGINGYRDYDLNEVARAKRLHCLFAVGMTTHQLQQISGCLDNLDPVQCSAMRDTLRGHIEDINQRIRQLETARDTLQRKLDR